MKKIKVLISAGGTGGHIFPALSVANKLKEMHKDIEIKFVGAEGKMEMQKVPAAGYPITGLPVIDFPRKPSLKMFTFFRLLWKAMRRAKRIVREFEPDVAAGFGGFASGPVLRVSAKRKVPYLLQEQNSYAGVTNKLLAKKAGKICVAYENMDRFFPAEKIVFTGNPIRASLLQKDQDKESTCDDFGFDKSRKVVFVTGGSLGARSLNEAVFANLDYFKKNDIQLLWQCGSLYFKEFTSRIGFQVNEFLHLTKFVENMGVAYECADLVIARAGACTISELCAVGIPSVFVPSPNVAEDHQTHNARALSDKGAAILLSDKDAKQNLPDVLDKVLKDEKLQNEMVKQMQRFAKIDADEQIAKEILKLAGINE